jgi:hypothetical protein
LCRFILEEIKLLECKLVEQLVEQPQLVEQHVEHLQLLEQQQSSTGGIDIGDNGLSSPQRQWGRS